MESYRSMSIKNWAVEDRPREKMLLKGIQSLSNAELLAVMIGSGSRDGSAVDLSRQILHGADNNLDKLGRYSVNDLKKIKGIGEAKAVTILAALELGRRRKTSGKGEDSRIKGSHDVFEMMQPLLADIVHEEFWILLLNRANKVVEKRKMSQGGISGTVTDIRMILKHALDCLASSMILCHNHPSGNEKPSEADIGITRKLKEATGIMDISLLDHVIIAGKTYFSFADENLL
ncbi:MAG: DNA repair protein RadC [Bacteroidales bacterium]|nr:DNA repair protein RadC [Bacteroidales bacterium]